jgi:hypothetical protein
MTQPEIEEMLVDCLGVKDIPRERGGPGFSTWEQEFLDSIEDQLGDGRQLSLKQRTILRELWDKI